MEDLQDNIETVISNIGYKFKNEDLLLQAFTRRSYSIENGGENNEILEFIGDRVLDYFVTKILIDYYGHLNEEDPDFNEDEDFNEFSVSRFDTEGKLTDIKQKLVNKKMLAGRIKSMGFNEYLYMGNGDIKQEKQYEDSVMEDLFEAILGAIAIDSNWDQEKLEESVKLMLNIDYYLENGFDDEEDYVNLIQERNLKEHGELPLYEYEENEVYPSNVLSPFMFNEGASYKFTAYLTLRTSNGDISFKGYGDSKSEARMDVAYKAYDYLEENDLLWSILDELPEEIDTSNSINVLQELAQKGYISMPQYSLDDYQTDAFKDGLSSWGCTVYVESEGLKLKRYSTSKKDAKKYAAYVAICKICGLNNIYEE